MSSPEPGVRLRDSAALVVGFERKPIKVGVELGAEGADLTMAE